MRVTTGRLAACLQPLFTTEADRLARATGFVRRPRKPSGASFLQAVVFGWLGDPAAPLEALADTAGPDGRPVTPRALEQRLTAAAAAALRAVFAAVPRHAVAATPERIPPVRRFTGASVEGRTTVAPPAGLADTFPGCGGPTPDQGRAALTRSVRLGLAAGGLDPVAFGPGTGGDLWAARQAPVLPAGAGRLADRGFFDVGVFRRDDTAGVFDVSRVPAHVRVNRPGEPPAKLAPFLARRDTDDFDGPVAAGGGR